MAELAVDLTYGTALMEAARELGKEDQILEEAQAVVQLIEDEPDLHKFINSPGVSADEKKADNTSRKTSMTIRTASPESKRSSPFSYSCMGKR